MAKYKKDKENRSELLKGWANNPEHFKRTRDQTSESKRIKERTGPVKVTCKSCGTKVSIESTSCGSCGEKFT